MSEIFLPHSLGDQDGVIWYNGTLVPWREARLHCLSHSLHYAGAVFDGIRVYDGRIFRPYAHIERLLKGASKLGMETPFSVADLVEAAKKLVDLQKIDTGYIRPLIWRGPGPLDFNPKPNPPNIMLAAWPLDIFLKNGSRLVLGDYRRPPPNAGPWDIKATGLYLPATLAKAQALEQGYDDALMLSWKGCVADTTGTNIFVVADGILYTPKPDGFFAGLTRQAIIDLARQIKIEVVIEDIPVDFLGRVQEVFLTGTAAGIVPVAEIDMKESGTFFFKHGPMIRRIAASYRFLTHAGPQAAII